MNNQKQNNSENKLLNKCISCLCDYVLDEFFIQEQLCVPCKFKQTQSDNLDK